MAGTRMLLTVTVVLLAMACGGSTVAAKYDYCQQMLAANVIIFEASAEILEQLDIVNSDADETMTIGRIVNALKRMQIAAEHINDMDRPKDAKDLHNAAKDFADLVNGYVLLMDGAGRGDVEKAGRAIPILTNDIPENADGVSEKLGEYCVQTGS